MATNHKAKFKKAIVKAKKLYKTGRYNKFSDAVKAAYNSLPGKTRSAKKSRSVGSKPKRRVAVKSGKTRGGNKGTLSGHMDAARKLIVGDMMFCKVQQIKATTKADKKKWQKKYNEALSKYKKLL
jgi:hypothetical protein